MDVSYLVESALYSLDTRRLLEKVRQGPLPLRVALILEGNRRFARLHVTENRSGLPLNFIAKSPRP